MERQHELQDIIDKHLIGRITPEEQEKLDAALAADPDLASEIELEEVAVAAIDAFEDYKLKARLRKVESRLQTANTSTKKNVVQQKTDAGAKIISFSSRRIMALAAAFLLLLAAGWFIFRPGAAALDGPALYAANFQPYRNVAVPLTRGSDDPSPEEVAYTAYEAQEWSQAATLIAELPASDANNFYLGQIALSQGDFATATSLLAPLTQKADFALAPMSEWYLVLSQLGQGDTEVAKVNLQSIATTEGHPFATKAQALLKEW